MALTRVTLNLDMRIIEEARLESDGNLSRFVSSLLEDRLDTLRRPRLREDLRAGYVSEAAYDLEIAEEFRFADDEMANTHRVLGKQEC